MLMERSTLEITWVERPDSSRVDIFGKQQDWLLFRTDPQNPFGYRSILESPVCIIPGYILSILPDDDYQPMQSHRPQYPTSNQMVYMSLVFSDCYTYIYFFYIYIYTHIHIYVYFYLCAVYSEDSGEAQHVLCLREQ